MKTLLGFLLVVLTVCRSAAQVPPMRASTPAETAAGVVRNAAVTPYSLAASGIGTQTNGITAATATNVARAISSTNNTTGNATTATTAGNITAGATLNPVNGAAVTNVNIAPQLNALTNSAALTSLVASNSTFGSYQINVNGQGAGVNTYGGGMYYLPNTDGGVSWQRISGASFSDSWGVANNARMRLGDSNFRGLMLNEFDYANPYNNLLEAGVAVSGNALAWGGSGAALTGVPIQPEANAEMLDYPPTVISSWNLADMVLVQTNVWEQLRNATTNGLLYAFTNQGLPLWYMMDVNVRWTTNSRQSGSLGINTTAFPLSTNFLQIWQTNGWKFSLVQYAVKEPTNNYIFSAVQQNAGEVAEGTEGSQPATTPVSLADDIETFYRWGIDMARYSDVQGDAGYQRYWPNAIADMILNPTSAGGFYKGFWKNVYHQGARLRPMAFQWMTPQVGFTDPRVFSQANVVNHDFAANSYGTYVGDNGSSNNVIHAMNLFRSIQTNEVPHLSKGHFGTGISAFADANTTTYARLNLSIATMQWGLINICTRTNQQLDAYMPIYCREMTNAAWVATRKDVTAQCYRVFDNGATNTSAWARRLADGSYLVFISNESNNTANVTYTWNKLGVPETQTYFVEDIWNSTNFGVFNRSQTLAVTATNHYLLRVSPVVQDVISFDTTSIDSGIARLGPGTFSGAPHYWESGLRQSGGAYGSYRIAMPNWVTNVVLETTYQTPSPSRWTNTIEVFYYSQGGRVVVLEEENYMQITGSDVVSNWTYTATFPVTNAPKVIGFQFRPSTNTANRDIGPTLKRTMR